MEMNDAICRPKEITCDEIWELYKLLECLDKRYMWYDARDKGYDNEKLYYLETVTLGDDGIVYEAPDPMGMQFPYSKNEWVELVLRDIENGKEKRCTCRVTVDALDKNDKSVDELLDMHQLRVAKEDELDGIPYEEKRVYGSESKLLIPVNDYPVPVKKEYTEKGERAKTAAHWLLRFLQNSHVLYKEGMDAGVSRCDIVFMCDHAPGRFVEVYVWFFEDEAKVLARYSSIGADICKRSEHRNELYKLLNFINTCDIMASPADGKQMRNLAIQHCPRICLTEEDESYDVSIMTIINYDFWKAATAMTYLYITEYLPKLMDMLAPYVFDLLNGEMSVSDAIAGVKSNLKNNGGNPL